MGYELYLSVRTNKVSVCETLQSETSCCSRTVCCQCLEGNPKSAKDRVSLIILVETTDTNLARVVQIKLPSRNDRESCAAPKIENMSWCRCFNVAGQNTVFTEPQRGTDH